MNVTQLTWLQNSSVIVVEQKVTLSRIGFSIISASNCVILVFSNNPGSNLELFYAHVL